MKLTNAQYDRIMRGYEYRQQRTRREQTARQEEVLSRIPRMRELDEKAAALSVECARSFLRQTGDGAAVTAAAAPDTAALRRELSAISRERRTLLSRYGYPEDYLDPIYECPDCRDTGYIDGKPCHCMQQAAIDLFCTQSGLRDILEQENFSHFSFDCYPSTPVVRTIGKSPREQMHYVVSVCRDFLESFDEQSGNLLFYGGTGLGKTFLSHCIAYELLNSAHSVLYYSSGDLFQKLGDVLFARAEAAGVPSAGESELEPSLLFESDLLIIDDLGSELTNAFVISQLFRILNERMNRKKSTLISTNLSLAQLEDRYTQRVSSRLLSSFTLLGFYGDDIRIAQKLERRA